MNPDSMNEHRQAIDDQALDWQIRLHAAPRNPWLRGAHRRWLQSSPTHQASWEQVQQLWVLTGQIQPVTRAHWPARRRRTGWLTAAAVVLLGLGVWWAPFANDDLNGQHQLADGSLIWGTPATRMQTHFDTAQRHVTLLAGKAFFDVVPDATKPFTVQAGDITVRVTGTSFAVNMEGEQVTVAVESGTVQVNHAEHWVALRKRCTNQPSA